MTRENDRPPFPPTYLTARYRQEEQDLHAHLAVARLRLRRCSLAMRWLVRRHTEASLLRRARERVLTASSAVFQLEVDLKWIAVALRTLAGGGEATA